MAAHGLHYRQRIMNLTAEGKARWYARIRAYHDRRKKADPEAWLALRRPMKRRSDKKKRISAKLEKAFS
jgi:hypothetical protein